jgi:hypothetical protein
VVLESIGTVAVTVLCLPRHGRRRHSAGPDLAVACVPGEASGTVRGAGPVRAGAAGRHGATDVLGNAR